MITGGPLMYLESAFGWVARSSAHAAVLVCLILAVQGLARCRLSVRWHYTLWFLLLIRMLSPWAPQSALSVFNILPDPPVVAGLDLVPATLEPIPGALFSETEAPLPDAGQPSGWSLATLLALGWAVGACMLTCRILWENLRFWRRIRREPCITDDPIVKLLEQCKRAMGLHTPVTLVASQAVRGPVLFGVIRPRILLPREALSSLSAEDLRFAFLHELAHVKRWDIAIAWLTALLQALHWFNPVIWFAFHRMRSDRELACDALALSHARPGDSRQYGQALISLLAQLPAVRTVPGMAGILEDKTQLKRRITMISMFNAKSQRWSILGIVLLTLLGAVVLTNAKAENTPAQENSGGEGKVTIVDNTIIENGEVVATIDANGRIVDKIDYPFVNDPQVIGTWKSVDFVRDPGQFTPNRKQWRGDLYLEKLVFVPEGKTHRPWWTWTKGRVFHAGDKTAAKYHIKNLDGAPFLFFEWRSGDYTIRHMKPAYYVLSKSSDTPDLNAEQRKGSVHDEAFCRSLAKRIPRIEIGKSTLEDITRILGKPLGRFRMVWEYPDRFQVFMPDDVALELRFEGPATGYKFREKIGVGTPLDEVLAVLGPPTHTVTAGPNLFHSGVLYKDIDGKKGYCYYGREDQGLRMFFVGNKVKALYLTAIKPLASVD